MLDRAGGRFADARRHLRGPTLADHDPGGAGALGDTADGPQVLRILDLVQRDDYGVVALEQAGGIGVSVGLRLSANALVIRRPA